MSAMMICRPPTKRWGLDLVADDDFFIAFVGYIDHYCEDFGEQLESLRKEKRFVGIRARNQGPTDYTDLRGQANS